MYQLKLERFEGPLDLLLQLIERQELSITDVSLAAVTEQYLAYLDQETTLPPEELADFLVVAAKLLLIKSRTLLPDLFVDEAFAEDTLTQQLELYRRYVQASRHLAARLRRRPFAYARERLPAAAAAATFSPPSTLTADALCRCFTRIVGELARYARPLPELIRRTVSLQEKIRALRSFFGTAMQVEFGDLVRSAETRTDIIVSFLALLELVKQRFVVVRQAGHGTAITVVRTTTVEVEP